MLTLKQLSKKTGGDYFGDDIVVSRFVFNSIDVAPGDIFIAIIADRDGHKYIDDAIERGASAIVVSKKQASIPIPQVVFKDTRAALCRLAHIWRKQFSIPVIAITGSCGKTTTKDILGSILSKQGTTVITYKNFNNDIGVNNLADLMEELI